MALSWAVIKKKLSILFDNELPLLPKLFPNIGLTKFSNEKGSF
jgi:hypothetical protein